MKTPRDLLLEQHRSAETKLKAISAEDLAAATRSSNALEKNEARSSLLISVIRNFWHESILPWRRVWLGIAAVWLGILTLNFASRVALPMTEAKAPASDSRIVLAAWRERRQQFAQLLGPAIPAVETIPKIPGPRSSLRLESAIV